MEIQGGRFWLESTANVANAASVTGSNRQIGSLTTGTDGLDGRSSFVQFVAQVFADKIGLLTIEGSVDGTTWLHCDEVATVASKGKNLSVRATMPFYRAKWANTDAAPTTSFRLTSGAAYS